MGAAASGKDQMDMAPEVVATVCLVEAAAGPAVAAATEMTVEVKLAADLVTLVV